MVLTYNPGSEIQVPGSRFIDGARTGLLEGLRISEKSLLLFPFPPLFFVTFT